MLLVFAGLLLGGTGCFSLKVPEVKGISGFKFNRKNDEKQFQAELNLRVYNPNKSKIVLQDYDLNVYLNGSLLGKAESHENNALKGLEECEVPFIIKTDLAKLAGTAMKVILEAALGNLDEMELHIQGKLKTKTRGISKIIEVDHSQNVKL